MRLTDLLALSHIPRWSVIEHSRPQSVADHTFRVCAIVLDLCERLGVSPTVGHAALRLALLHDGAESRTADIPRPFKHALRDEAPPNLDLVGAAERRMCPWLNSEPPAPGGARSIVALADLIECFTFINAQGYGPTARAVADHCHTELMSAVSALAGEYDPHVVAVAWSDVVSAILTERGRFPILPPK